MVKIDPNKLQRLIIHNAKILDINHGGPCTMTCDLSGTFPPNTRALVIYVVRNSGSGGLTVYADSAGSGYNNASNDVSTIPIVNQEIKYKQGTGSDDWDVYAIAYIIEGTVKSA